MTHPRPECRVGHSQELPLANSRLSVSARETYVPTSNTIFVVDPDRSSVSVVRAAARSIDVDCVSFRSAEQFLDSRRSPRIGCVVAEMQLPGLSGLELQESLIAKNSSLPMIFVTAYAKTSRTVLAMRGGAVTVLDKVPTAAELADAFHQALSRSKTLHRIDSQHSHVRRRMARLSAKNDRCWTSWSTAKPMRGSPIEWA